MPTQDGDLPIYNLYYNGQWRAPMAEHYRAAMDPSTGGKLAMIAQAGIEDTRLAIQSARDAFDEASGRAWDRVNARVCCTRSSTPSKSDNMRSPRLR